MATDAVARTMANDALALAQKAASVEQSVVLEVPSSMVTTMEAFATYVTELVIPEGVTALTNPVTNEDDGAMHFTGFANLKKVTLPSTMTKIPYHVLGYYSPLENVLKEVVISEGTTEISNYAFEGMAALESATLPQSLTRIGNSAFMNCHSLKVITIPSGVASIGDSAFYDCPELKTITIHKPEGSITGSPWGATNATVVWTG